MDDLVIRGGMILTAQGRSRCARGSRRVRERRITAITPHHSGSARRVVDARGQTVAPGFIDIKTHSDYALPYARAGRPAGRDDRGGRALRASLPVAPGRRASSRTSRGLRALIETRETTFAAYMDGFPPATAAAPSCRSVTTRPA
jgi:N-acyl-D-amino-acid deacylase